MTEFEGREYEEREEEEEARSEPGDSYVTVEITSLSVYTHHGVTRAERETGQRLVFDVSLDLEDCDATVTDPIEDTLVERFGASGVVVRATKPEPPLPVAVEEVSVEVSR